MAMKSNNDQDEIVSEINMTPLIDIMLVLLIIFMVSSSAAIESGLDVTLPETSAVSDKTDAILIISLSKSGDIAVQGNKATIETLRETVTENLNKLKTDTVILEGDGDSDLSTVMNIMDIARNAGAKNFSIAAKLKSQGG
jgi:biopolymer transport protein ExbD